MVRAPGAPPPAATRIRGRPPRPPPSQPSSTGRSTTARLPGMRGGRQRYERVSSERLPRYCTNVATNITLASDRRPPTSRNPTTSTAPPAPGPGVLISDPSTWTGTITISSSGNNTFDDTFVGGSISYTAHGGDPVAHHADTPHRLLVRHMRYASNPVPPPAQATQLPGLLRRRPRPGHSRASPPPKHAGSCALNLYSGGNLTLDGDVFVTNGTAGLPIFTGQPVGG